MNKEEVIKHIKELELSYCEDVNTLGVKGWLKYLSDDVIFCTQGHHQSVKGIETVKKRLTGLYTADYVLYHWDVEFVEVSDDFSMAYSYSTFTYKIVKGEDRKTYIGKDCNIWRKINGKFKVVMQIGNRIETQFKLNVKSMAKLPRRL